MMPIPFPARAGYTTNPPNNSAAQNITVRDWEQLLQQYNRDNSEEKTKLFQTIKITFERKSHNLDLVMCDTSTVTNLGKESPAIIGILKKCFTEICLPKNLNTIPDWIKEMGKLETLDIPNVDVQNFDIPGIDFSPLESQKTLDLRTLKQTCTKLNEIRISTNQSANVFVDEGVKVRSSEKSRASMDVQIKVYIYNKDQQLLSQITLAGHSYYAQYRGSKLQSTLHFNNWNKNMNLNGKASFPDGSLPGMDQSIICRHIATYWLWQRKEPGERLLESMSTKIGKIKTIQENIPATMDMRFEEISTQGKENYLVGHTAWGSFISHQFGHIETNANLMQGIIVLSGSHAMALLLKVKNVQGAKEYVVEFFDPNLTLTHARRVETDKSKFTLLEINDFMNKEQRASYYKEEDCSLFIKAPKNLYNLSMNQPLWVDDDRKRMIEFFPKSLFNTNSATVMWHAVISDLPDLIRQQLAGMKNISLEEKKAILGAKDSGEIPKLLTAFLRCNPETIKTFLAGIKELNLDQTYLVELLSVKDELNSPLFSIMLTSEGKAKHVEAFLDGIKGLGLDNIHLHELLLAKNDDGEIGLSSAVWLNYRDTVFAFLTGFRGLGLGPENLLELFKSDNCSIKGALAGCELETKDDFLTCIRDMGLRSSEVDSVILTIGTNPPDHRVATVYDSEFDVELDAESESESESESDIASQFP